VFGIVNEIRAGHVLDGRTSPTTVYTSSYVVVVMVMEEVMVKGMMVKMVVEMANECQ
jgi:hypothetical protein